MNQKRDSIAFLAITLFAVALLAPGRAFAGETEDLATAHALERAFAHAAKTARQATVFIEVDREVRGKLAQGPYNDPFDLFNDDSLQRFFGQRTPQKRTPQKYFQSGQGSGFLISSDGLIMSNHHVVGEADRIRVRLHDGRTLPGKLVGTDKKSDVALIRIEAKGLPFLEFGNSDTLRVGNWVVAVGNPFGLTETVTSGIVSAKGRSTVGIADYENFIQTDAAINPGNSGGPLINLEGKVVGINSAIYTRTGGHMGIGFAVPINLARNIKDQLLRDGKVRRGYLGVLVQDLTPGLAKSFGASQSSGALVAQVTKDSPAADAGLKEGDIITAVQSKTVKNSGDVRNAIGALQPGTKAVLAIQRNGKTLEISVTLGLLADQPAERKGTTADELADKLGLDVGPLTDELAHRFGYAAMSGVIVRNVTPGTVAARAGLRPGELITEVDRKPVRSLEDFNAALSAGAKAGQVLLRVRQGQYVKYVVLTLPR